MLTILFRKCLGILNGFLGFAGEIIGDHKEKTTISTLKYRVLIEGLSKGEVIHREGELC